jgi:hypothetical protein
MNGARPTTFRSDGVLNARTNSGPSVTANRSSWQSSALASLNRPVQLKALAMTSRTPTTRPLSFAAPVADCGTPVLWKWLSVNRAPL